LRGAPPIALDEEVAFEAQELLDTWVCYDDAEAENPNEVEPSKAAICRPAKLRRLENEEDDCHMNVWTNPDGAEGTTAEAAVQAWYAQGEFFDYATGKPTDDAKEKEAFEFINVVSKETTSVGFAIRGPTVIGYYCPPATTDPEKLKTIVPKERIAPEPPALPEDIKLEDVEGLTTENWPCPLLKKAEEEDEKDERAPCSAGFCCGESVGKDKDGEEKKFFSCRDSTKTAFVDDGADFTFSCYLENARRLAISISAVAAVVAFNY
jgi:hypothetical protein